MDAEAAGTIGMDETDTLIGSDKVEGTAVYDRQGNKLGSITRLMIDKVSGKVVFAVMSFGGFMGIGDRHYPLPWAVLSYDRRQGGYVVDLSREVIEGGPSYAAAETPDWDDRVFAQTVHHHYRIAPYAE